MIQGSSEWLDWRRKGIGGSDIAAVIGVCPYNTPYTVWLDKTGRKPSFAGNASTEIGKQFEAKARALYELINFEDMPPAEVIHPKYSFLRVSLDGISEDKKRILELKVSGSKNPEGSEAHKSHMAGIIPVYRIPQLQWQLAATGSDICDAFSYNPHDDGHRNIEVFPDLDYQAKLIIAGQDFWFNHVLKDVPPPFTERDVKEVTDDQALINLATLIFNEHELLSKTTLNKLKAEFVERGGHNKVKCGKVQVSTVIRNGKFSFHKLTVEKEHENVSI